MSSRLFYLSFGIALIVLIDPATGALKGGKKEKTCIRIYAQNDAPMSNDNLMSSDFLPTTDEVTSSPKVKTIEELTATVETGTDELQRRECKKNGECCDGCSCKAPPARTDTDATSTKDKESWFRRIFGSRSGKRYCTLNKNGESCTEPRKSMLSKVRGWLPGGKGKEQEAKRADNGNTRSMQLATYTP